MQGDRSDIRPYLGALIGDDCKSDTLFVKPDPRNRTESGEGCGEFCQRQLTLLYRFRVETR